MHEVKLAIETLSKRSKEGRYPSQRLERIAKADPNLGEDGHKLRFIHCCTFANTLSTR